MNHEIRDDTVKDNPVIEPVVGQEDEVVYRDRGLGREKIVMTRLQVGWSCERIIMTRLLAAGPAKN